MKSMYLVQARAVPQGVWMALGHFEGLGYAHAIRRARVIKKQYATWPHFQATLVANKSGRNLGKTRYLDFPVQPELYA